MKIKYQRVIDFMALFTEEEKDSWLNEDGVTRTAPNWVVEGIVWFMDQDPGHRNLMERLARDD